MVYGIEPEILIRANSDAFDFMQRIKVDRSSKLILGNREIQRTSRYYVAVNGHELKKISPPTKGNEIGQFKRKNGLTDLEYSTILAEINPGTWDARIHTGNKSKHELRETSICAGWKVAECNDFSSFDFANVNYEYYIQEARKLVIK
jgi:hypothetical protein